MAKAPAGHSPTMANGAVTLPADFFLDALKDGPTTVTTQVIR